MKAERRFLLRLALACALLAAGAAAYTAVGGSVTAKETSLAGSSAPGGVAVHGSRFRYVAISPNRKPRLTVVERIEAGSGRVRRWWWLPGVWMIPAGSYDLDGAGLSGDEGTLVLSSMENGDYRRWPRVTKLAVLDTEVHLRHPSAPDGVKMEHAVRRIRLRGVFEVAAVSPDGSTAYLAQTTSPHRIGAQPRSGESAFQIRALDLARGRLSPVPALSRDGPIGLEGSPIDRVSSRDGRWSYGLYIDERGEVFVLGIDTASGRIARVDLPLRHLREPFDLHIGIGRDGRSLVIFRHAVKPQGRSAPLAWVALPIAAAAEPPPVRDGPLGFLFTPAQPGNLMVRTGTAGESVDGRTIQVRQFGDPARPATLVFGCIHGDECAARHLDPVFIQSGGCPDPAANLAFVPDLDPDGFRAGTRLNADGVDLNRNFAAAWRPIGRPGDPQYSGPRPFSEPESGLAARLVRTIRPRVTIWFHQHHGPGAHVRAWGQSAPAGRRFAGLAGIAFHLLPWPDGTAPHWQNRAFPGTASFVVELPPGPLAGGLARRLGVAEARLAHEVGEDGYVAKGEAWELRAARSSESSGAGRCRRGGSGSSCARRSAAPRRRWPTSTPPTGAAPTAPPTSSSTTRPPPRTSPRTPSSRRSAPSTASTVAAPSAPGCTGSSPTGRSTGRDAKACGAASTPSAGAKPNAPRRPRLAKSTRT